MEAGSISRRVKEEERKGGGGGGGGKEGKVLMDGHLMERESSASFIQRIQSSAGVARWTIYCRRLLARDERGGEANSFAAPAAVSADTVPAYLTPSRDDCSRSSVLGEERDDDASWNPCESTTLRITRSYRSFTPGPALPAKRAGAG